MSASSRAKTRRALTPNRNAARRARLTRRAVRSALGYASMYALIGGTSPCCSIAAATSADGAASIACIAVGSLTSAVIRDVVAPVTRDVVGHVAARSRLDRLSANVLALQPPVDVDDGV